MPIRCLAHVANLATIEIMAYVTKIGLVESHILMWEYDPSDEDNRVLGGHLDVIAVLRTLTIKVRGGSFGLIF